MHPDISIETSRSWEGSCKEWIFYPRFPEDKESWRVEDQYMYGPKYLVAPILEAKQTKREVYIPGAGIKWKGVDGNEYEGGKRVTVHCPLDTMPVFTRDI